MVRTACPADRRISAWGRAALPGPVCGQRMSWPRRNGSGACHDIQSAQRRLSKVRPGVFHGRSIQNDLPALLPENRQGQSRKRQAWVYGFALDIY